MTPALRIACLADFDVMFCCSGINTDPAAWDPEQKFTELQNAPAANVKNICYAFSNISRFLKIPVSVPGLSEPRAGVSDPRWLWRGGGDVPLPGSAVGARGRSR